MKLNELSHKELHMKLGLEFLLLMKSVQKLSFYRFYTLFNERGLCARSRIALNASIKQASTDTWKEETSRITNQFNTISEIIHEINHRNNSRD